MITLIQYSKTTGQIVLTINTNSPMDLSTYQTNEFDALFVEGTPSPEDVYVVNQEFVPYPERPNYPCTWDGTTWQINTVAVEARVRNTRDELLLRSDWTDGVSAESRLGYDLHNQWQTYRQALRDVTSQAGFPLSIIWPTPPA